MYHTCIRILGIGNPRGNENPYLLTMGVMWFRYHNYWARRLQSENPDWDDERIFNTARKMVIGVYQVSGTSHIRVWFYPVVTAQPTPTCWVLSGGHHTPTPTCWVLPGGHHTPAPTCWVLSGGHHTPTPTCCVLPGGHHTPAPMCWVLTGGHHTPAPTCWVYPVDTIHLHLRVGLYQVGTTHPHLRVVFYPVGTIYRKAEMVLMLALSLK